MRRFFLLKATTGPTWGLDRIAEGIIFSDGKVVVYEKAYPHMRVFDTEEKALSTIRKEEGKIFFDVIDNIGSENA